MGDGVATMKNIKLYDRSMLVLLWALTLHGDPTPDNIQQRWNVSRATAYRWVSKLRDARSLFSMRHSARNSRLLERYQ